MISNLNMTLAAGFILAATLIATAASAATVTGTGATAAAKPAPVRTPQSIECSKQADAKGLHGKARETFRSTCKHDLSKSTQATPPATK